MGKHHLQIDASEQETAFIHKFVFRSVRNKVLQKLLLINYNLFYETQNPILERINKRLHEQHILSNKSNISWELKPEDITDIIGCSQRTAKEYISVFQYFYK